MTSLVWNYQGIGQSRTVRALHDLLYKYRQCIIFLMETKQRRQYMTILQHWCGYPNSLFVDPVSIKDELSHWWDNLVDLDPRYLCQNFMDHLITLNNTRKYWKMIFVYGCSDQVNRDGIWGDLTALRPPMSLL